MPDLVSPAIVSALVAAAARVYPHLSAEKQQAEALWQYARAIHPHGGQRIAWASMSLGKALRGQMATAQGWRCCICDGELDSAAPRNENRPTFLHVVPLRDGGADHPDNLAISCRPCNQQRTRQTREPTAKAA